MVETTGGFCGGNGEYPLVIQQFAIENGPCMIDLPIINGDFPWLCEPFTRGAKNIAAIGYPRAVMISGSHEKIHHV